MTSHAETAAPREPRIFYSFTRPAPEANPYTTLLAELVNNSADVVYFSWKRALLSRYDVFHVQWPESLVRPYTRSRLAPAAGTVKLLLSFVLLLRNRVTGVKMVWTVHNCTPHEKGNALERAFIALFLRWVDHRIFLNREEVDEHGRPSSVIVHPDYSPVVQPGLVDTGDDRSGGPLLFFGRLVPYKGVESLIDIMIANPQFGDLVVAGQAADAEYGAALLARASGHDQITVAIGHVEQNALESMIAHARIVVLPYRYVYNSGALLLALTLRTPVLVRSSGTTRPLRDEVGTDWVSLFDDDLTPTDVAAALDNSRRAIAGAGPDLSARSWAECAQRHVELYRSLSRG
jgi:beta-1,4-mannosyltransferase